MKKSIKAKLKKDKNILFVKAKNPKFEVGMGAYRFQDNSGYCEPLTIIDIKGEVGSRTITFQKDDTVVTNYDEKVICQDYEIGYERNLDNTLCYIQEKNFCFGEAEGWTFQESFLNPFTKKLNLDIGRICIGERHHKTPQTYLGFEKEQKRFS